MSFSSFFIRVSSLWFLDLCFREQCSHLISSFLRKKRQTIPIAYFARFYLLPEPPIVSRRSSTITDRLAKPLTQLPATVVITLGLLLVGSLYSLLSSPPPGTIRILRSWCLSLVPFGSLGAPSDLAHRFPDHTERSLFGRALFTCSRGKNLKEKGRAAGASAALRVSPSITLTR